MKEESMDTLEYIESADLLAVKNSGSKAATTPLDEAKALSQKLAELIHIRTKERDELNETLKILGAARARLPKVRRGRPEGSKNKPKDATA